jgi:predicted nucleotidyltransferase
MRTLLDALFSKTKQGLLAALVLHPEKWWYLSDLAKQLKTSPSSVQRDLRSFVEAGILQRRVEGKRVYFRPDEQCPLLPELRGIFLKTSGLVDVLKGALKGLSSGIDFAFVYGSIARGEDLSRSDVDLFVVGNVGLADLAPKLKDAERILLREVNPLTYSMNEFRRKFKNKDHFVSSVIKSDKLFLHGQDDYLEAVGK